MTKAETSTMDEELTPVRSTRTDILGVPVDAINMQAALASIRTMLTTTTTHVIAAVNPEKVIAAQQNKSLMCALDNATLVIPDGIGVVLAARLLGKQQMERVSGSDLMPAICQLAANEGHRVFLYGAKPETVTQTAALLLDKYAGLNIVGIQHGYVAEEEMGHLIHTINDSGANVLFVGTGSPRQELWMDRYRNQLNVQICQGVGGTFDAICGNPKRAPAIIQRMYLEWFYRLITQPQRLRRQTAIPRFVIQVIRQAITRQ